MVKKAKRNLTRRRKDGNIDPRLVALAGAAGAVAGRGIARARTNAAVKKDVANAVAYHATTLNNEYGTAVKNSAKDMYRLAYQGMPRVDEAKMAVAKRIRGEMKSNKPMTFKDMDRANISAAKKAGLSGKEISKVTAKRNARLGSFDYPTERYMREASKIRSSGPVTRAGRRGAAAGALSAAAVATIVQAVLKELNKK